jgi:hypothetical protein
MRPSHASAKYLKDAPPLPKAVKKEKFTEGLMVKGRNEPATLPHVAYAIAQIKEITVEEVCDAYVSRMLIKWQHTNKPVVHGRTQSRCLGLVKAKRDYDCNVSKHLDQEVRAYNYSHSSRTSRMIHAYENESIQEDNSSKLANKSTASQMRQDPSTIYFLYHILVILVCLIFFCSWKMPYMSASAVGGHPGT